MAYSDKVVDHFANPQNVGSLDKNDPNVGTGLVGAPACGDVMKLQLNGYISIHDFNEEHKSLKLQMGGGCHGCASSKLTMMLGVERHFREIFPDIGEIEDVTDHLTGETPYFV
jgi:NifU-like protein involved in Fe-S cluster formation